MTTEKCQCGEHESQQNCASCRSEEIFAYWCKSCNRSVPDKRCPYCGLKAQKKKV